MYMQIQHKLITNLIQLLMESSLNDKTNYLYVNTCKYYTPDFIRKQMHTQGP